MSYSCLGYGPTHTYLQVSRLRDILDRNNVTCRFGQIKFSFPSLAWYDGEGISPRVEFEYFPEPFNEVRQYHMIDGVWNSLREWGVNPIYNVPTSTIETVTHQITGHFIDDGLMDRIYRSIHSAPVDPQQVRIKYGTVDLFCDHRFPSYAEFSLKGPKEHLTKCTELINAACDLPQTLSVELQSKCRTYRTKECYDLVVKAHVLDGRLPDQFATFARDHGVSFDDPRIEYPSSRICYNRQKESLFFVDFVTYDGDINPVGEFVNACSRGDIDCKIIYLAPKEDSRSVIEFNITGNFEVREMIEALQNNVLGGSTSAQEKIKRTLVPMIDLVDLNIVFNRKDLKRSELSFFARRNSKTRKLQTLLQEITSACQKACGRSKFTIEFK